MIHLDTSVLVAAFSGKPAEFAKLRAFIDAGERPAVCSVVLYEWWRGPRAPRERANQELLVPAASACPFATREAEIAARLYRGLKRQRGREIDIAIAACAIAQDAALWTLNRADFADIPGLALV